MAQRSAAEIAAELGVREGDPMVLEHLQAMRQIQDAAAKAARQLGTGDGRGTANVFSRRARRSATPDEPAPPPPTPKPKRSGDEAGCPGTAEKDGNRNPDAVDRKARRGALEASARHSQSFAGELRDDDKDNAKMAPPPPRPPPKARPPPPPTVATPSEAARRALDPSLIDAMNLGDTQVRPLQRLPLQAPPAPPQQPPAPQPSSPPRTMDEEGNDSTEYSWDSDRDSDRDSDPGSNAPLHPYQRYAQLVSTKSLTNMPPAELLRVLDEFKRLTHAVKPGAYEKTCASLESSESVPVLAATVVERLVGFLGINDALLVFDAKEKDVAVRESSRAATLRADVTRWKEAKGRAAQAALQAERASAPKSVEDSVKALKHSFELREKCSVACSNAVRWGTSAGCTCDASNSWSSRGILVDITGKSKPRLHFSDGTSFEVYSLSALKTRLRPAGGGSGEEAVALLQEAARAARDKPGWKADVILAWE